MALEIRRRCSRIDRLARGGISQKQNKYRKKLVMKNSPKRVLERMNRVLHAWQTIRPTETFAGMTLEEFRLGVQASLTSRERLAEHQSQANAAIAQRNAADEATMLLIRRLVSGVKGHALEGENGEMYRVLGYILSNERASGLTRRTRDEEPVTQLKAA